MDSFNGYRSNTKETGLLNNKDYTMIIPQQYFYWTLNLIQLNDYSFQ